jgi:exo-beta-1,3-glucanase (GH17 family)
MYKRVGIIVLSASLAFSLSACAQNAKNANNNQLRTKATENRLSVKQQTGNVDHAKSDQIKNQILNMKEVKHATVFVHGNDVVTGLEVHENMNKAEVEKSVRNTIQASHSGYKVHVTTDNALHQRIANIHSQMVPLDGHPVRNFATDVEVLIKDIGRAVTAPLR